MIYYKRKIIISLILLVFVAGLFFDSAGIVLCIGSNNHLKLEKANLPCCTGESEDCKDAICAADHDGHADCGHCTDIPMSADSILRRPSTARNIIADNQSTLPNNIPGESIDPAKFLNNAQPSSLADLLWPPNKKQISSTVLRC